MPWDQIGYLAGEIGRHLAEKTDDVVEGAIISAILKKALEKLKFTKSVSHQAPMPISPENPSDEKLKSKSDAVPIERVVIENVHVK